MASVATKIGLLSTMAFGRQLSIAAGSSAAFSSIKNLVATMQADLDWLKDQRDSMGTAIGALEN